MLKEKNIEVEFSTLEPTYVFADEFYIKQVVTNYITNAIKHCEEKNGKRVIKVNVEKVKDKIRVKVYNSGEQIGEEDLRAYMEKIL